MDKSRKVAVAFSSLSWSRVTFTGAVDGGATAGPSLSSGMGGGSSGDEGTAGPSLSSGMGGGSSADGGPNTRARFS